MTLYASSLTLCTPSGLGPASGTRPTISKRRGTAHRRPCSGTYFLVVLKYLPTNHYTLRYQSTVEGKVASMQKEYCLLHSNLIHHLKPPTRLPRPLGLIVPHGWDYPYLRASVSAFQTPSDQSHALIPPVKFTYVIHRRLAYRANAE